MQAYYSSLSVSIVADILEENKKNFGCLFAHTYVCKNKQACREKEQKIKNSRFDLYSEVVFKREDGKINKKLKIPVSESQDGKSIW